MPGAFYLGRRSDDLAGARPHRFRRTWNADTARGRKKGVAGRDHRESPQKKKCVHVGGLLHGVLALHAPSVQLRRGAGVIIVRGCEVDQQFFVVGLAAVIGERSPRYDNTVEVPV